MLKEERYEKLKKAPAWAAANVPAYLKVKRQYSPYTMRTVTMTEMLTVGICFYTESYKTSTNYSAYTKHLVVAT